MVSITYQDRTVELCPEESVLDGLLRSGFNIPHSCRTGVCHSCVMRAKIGQPPPVAQAGLKDTHRQRGYFKACLCRPESELVIADADDGLQIPVRVHTKSYFSQEVLRLCLTVENPFTFYSGQFATLRRTDGLMRSYSIASLPSDGVLEFHIRRTPNGRMSGWLHDTLAVGDPLELRGPYGECFYIPGQPDRSLLLVGTGTGLAPLYGILRDALFQQHQGAIWLFHGAVRESELYLNTELRTIVSTHSNVHYRGCVLQVPATCDDIDVGPIDTSVIRSLSAISRPIVYVCGDPGTVTRMKKQLFLSGISLQDIHTDPFVPSADTVSQAR